MLVHKWGGERNVPPPFRKINITLRSDGVESSDFDSGQGHHFPFVFCAFSDYTDDFSRDNRGLGDYSASKRTISPQMSTEMQARYNNYDLIYYVLDVKNMSRMLCHCQEHVCGL